MLALFAAAVSLPPTACAKPTKLERMNQLSRELARERNQDIVFYGKTVDFNGDPVAGVVVKMHTRIFGARSPSLEFRDYESVSDQEGLFKVEGFGELIEVKDISKDGYEFKTRYTGGQYFPSKTPDHRKGRGYEPSKPAIFKVRKRGAAALVELIHIGLGLSEKQAYVADFFLGRTAEVEAARMTKIMFKGWHSDMRLSLERDGDNFKVILEMLDPDSGLQIHNKGRFYEEMTEAPEHGYQPQLVLPLKRGERKSVRLYVKSQGGALYSSMDVIYENRPEYDGVTFKAGARSNLTGARDLEFDSGIAARYRNAIEVDKSKLISRERLVKEGPIDLPALLEGQPGGERGGG
jgi:hypothetical protein